MGVAMKSVITRHCGGLDQTVYSFQNAFLKLDEGSTSSMPFGSSKMGEFPELGPLPQDCTNYLLEPPSLRNCLSEPVTELALAGFAKSRG